MSVERRGQATRVMVNLANWQQEGRLVVAEGGSSQWMARMGREAQVRICERLGVRLPGPTRRVGSDGRPYRDQPVSGKLRSGIRC